MPVSDELFRAAMARLAGGVAIVTARDPGGTLCGMTATAVTSVSLAPPLVMACLDLTSRTHAAIESSGAFALNFLGESSHTLAIRFASGESDKFDGVELIEAEAGTPLLADALAWCECVVSRSVPAGDHTLFIGRVERAGARDGSPERPLVYHWGRYYTLDSDSAPEPGR